MSGISFENGASWMVRNRAFDTFMKAVIRDHPTDAAIVAECESAIANYGLHFELLRKEPGNLAQRLFEALEQTTRRILAEEHFASPTLGHDEEGRGSMRDQIARLAGLLEHAKNAEAR